MMKRRFFASVLSAALVFGAVALFTGCGKEQGASAENGVNAAAGKEAVAKENATAADKEAADKVAKLIDKIYVQKKTATTEADCKAAKAAWDALTDTQKELVEGEFADPDYFGRDTGDVSKDDPLNSDKNCEKEILVVSFGTSFNDSRVNDIGGIEKAITAAFPDHTVRRAFTSQIIINHILARDGEKIDNMEEALERAKKSGVKELIVQPTHLMNGAEYDELKETLEGYKDSFETIKIASPLLGADSTEENSGQKDKTAVAKAVVADTLGAEGLESLKEAQEQKKAFVFVGHGTSHAAKAAYSSMQKVMDELGYSNVFIGTVEGEPEETSCENIIKTAKEKGYEAVVMRPLMVVAGDHANNDIAGDDEDSWFSSFRKAGIESLSCVLNGLGSISDIQAIYVEHTGEAAGLSPKKSDAAADTLSAGEYKASFKTDSSMFRVNEADNGLGVLTVKSDGSMSIKVNLASKNIINLYAGKASDAENDKANRIDPIDSSVTYPDGTKEEVYAFEIPVPSLDTDFDVAILGTKGKWYDHVCSVKLS